MPKPLFVLLPLISFLLTLLAWRRRLQNHSWCEAFLATSVFFGVGIVLATEALGGFRLICFTAFFWLWITVALVSAITLFLSPKIRPPVPPSSINRLALIPRLLLGSIFLYVLAIAVIALVSPPNNWDSMEYHMPKVMHWIQNASVSFYPTAIPRQNHLAPGAEFAILHLQLLSGSDHFANMIEWFAMVGSLVAVALIARQLGANITGQLLAAIFTLTLPMGIMQASSTQTDYVAAFWFVCFLYYLVRLVPSHSISWPLLLGLSSSLGLAVFSKATVYIFAAAFVLWMALTQIKQHRWRTFIPFALVAVVFMALNASHYVRNWNVYANPLGPYQEPAPNTQYTLDSHSPAALASNLAKNISTHINTPWPRFNAAIQQGYVAFHQVIGWDVNDPRTSWGSGGPPFSIAKTPFQDERDGNPVHFLLMFSCGVAVLLVPTLRCDRTLLIYGMAIVAGFVLFAFYLKWHPWMSRLHLPLFVAMGPFAAVILVRLLSAKGAAVVAGLLLLLALPWMLFCQQRPVLAQETIFNATREHLYFKTPHQNYEAAFLAGRDFLRTENISQVGLIAGNSSWEYMWWVLLSDNNHSVRIEHVNVTDPSNRLYEAEPFRNFHPQALVLLDQQTSSDQITVGSATFSKCWTNEAVTIYLEARETSLHP